MEVPVSLHTGVQFGRNPDSNRIQELGPRGNTPAAARQPALKVPVPARGQSKGAASARVRAGSPAASPGTRAELRWDAWHGVLPQSPTSGRSIPRVPPSRNANRNARGSVG